MKIKENNKKAIIFDAGALISLSINGLLNELRKLKGIFKGSFLITEQVKAEVIDKPLKIKEFELEALKVQQLLDDKVLEMADSYGINNSLISKKTEEILNIANSLFMSSNIKMNIMQLGEASCLALSNILSEKGVENIIAIDERTTRMLVEKPENLKELLERKTHAKIILLKKDFQYFKNFKIIRSVELMYVAWKKNLIDLKKGDVLDAVLYALKFKGCSVSDEEIDEIKKLK
ncbi:MAG: hypothetical protein AABY32_04585 [Nanoarchaeota archaeon]